MMKKMLFERRNVYAAVAGLIMLLGLLWVGFDDPFRQNLWLLGCLYALLALGMYIPIVLAQSVSLAYSVFAAIGGYAVALFATNGMSSWWAWILAPFIAATVSIALGWVTRQLSGFHLVAVTLLFANAFTNWVRTSDFVGGADGISGIPRPSIFSWQISMWNLVILGTLAVWLIATLLDRLRTSRWGVIARSMGEVPHAVEASGVKVTSLELVGLGLGAAIATVGGTLFTSAVNTVNPEVFHIELVFLALFMPVIGGIGTTWGAVLGAGLVVHLTLNTEWLGDSGMLIVAAGALIILLIAPGGIISLFEGFAEWLKKIVRTPEKSGV